MTIDERAPHLLLITTSYPWQADGREAAGAFVRDFAAALAEQVRVSVVAPAPEQKVEQDGTVAVHYFCSPRLPLSLLKPWSPGDWAAIWRVLTAGQATCEAVHAARPVDHSLALWALPSGQWARRLGSGTVPYSVWGLGSDIWTLGRIPGVSGILRQVLRGAEHCFADGLQLASDMECISGRACGFLPSARVFARMARRRCALKPPYRLAFLGRWHPNKGIDLLLEALRQLGPEDWQRVHGIRIAGGGPLDSQVRRDVAALDVNGHPVQLQGFLDYDGAAELFDWADYILLPSRIESIPVIFSDAMQARRPLIATPVGDMPRLLADYGTGVLARTETAEAFADAIAAGLRQDPKRLHRGFDRAARDFDIRQAALRFAAMLNNPKREPTPNVVVESLR
jgi:glycosyltransferase involved in cell wall biosynthesis